MHHDCTTANRIFNVNILGSNPTTGYKEILSGKKCCTFQKAMATYWNILLLNNHRQPSNYYWKSLQCPLRHATFKNIITKMFMKLHRIYSCMFDSDKTLLFSLYMIKEIFSICFKNVHILYFTYMVDHSIIHDTFVYLLCHQGRWLVVLILSCQFH